MVVRAAVAPAVEDRVDGSYVDSVAALMAE